MLDALTVLVGAVAGGALFRVRGSEAFERITGRGKTADVLFNQAPGGRRPTARTTGHSAIRAIGACGPLSQEGRPYVRRH